MRAAISDGGTFLFSERGVTALRGPQVAALASLLDGTRDLATLQRSRPAGLAADQVVGLVQQLIDADLVALRPDPAPAAEAPEIAYWDSCGLDPVTAREGVSGRVGLTAVGTHIDVAAVAQALEASGTSVALGGDETAELTVVLCDDYLNPELTHVDAAHRAAGRPWLLAKPVGGQVWIGPVFQPGAGPCLHCLTTRLWGHRNAEATAQRLLGESGPAQRPLASVAPLAGAAAQLIALEATKWQGGHRYPGQHSVWTFDSLDFRGRHHEVRARPQCPHCGDPSLVAAQAWSPIRLRPVRRACYAGGGYRSRTPEQVLRRYRHLVSPVSGVIKEIKQDTRGPDLFNSFRSGPNFGAVAGDVDALRSSLRDESGGKGVTAIDAEVGALCEALERISGRYHGDEVRVRASFCSLGEEAIHPGELLLYDEKQYADRRRWNAEHAPAQHVCEPFDENAELDWTPVWSLTGGHHRLVPTRMLYYGAPGPRSVRADSNGNAAGTCLEDAVLQGLLELVERDAVALWWYNRTSAPGVDLDAFGDPWLAELRRAYREIGREVWVLDVSADLEVPVMAAVSRRTDGPAEDIMFGFGAHLDPHIALRRALTELNQLMPALLSADAGAEFSADDPDARRWWRTATAANQPYLVPDRAQPLRGPGDFGHRPGADLAADVASLTTRLRARGLEAFVLDQTRPDLELPVVKVMVPGMRHFWARFAPGRLYDVPVRLGRLREPTPYAELNPLPLFL
ncbi:TOMM precursor leader peptide-binding protein [Saccharopolyspora indica]|uniref:TOMM precursor leader peptide-binding protein n=1 Tax=Saccharopolyspora indica TaxID=1229659 RepID=UPI002FE56DFE